MALGRNGPTIAVAEISHLFCLFYGRDEKLRLRPEIAIGESKFLDCRELVIPGRILRNFYNFAIGHDLAGTKLFAIRKRFALRSTT